MRSSTAGATVVNDTSGLRDPELAAVVAEHVATVVITHSLAGPRQHFPQPQYADVVAEVKRFLADRVEYAVGQGVAGRKVALPHVHAEFAAGPQHVAPRKALAVETTARGIFPFRLGGKA